MHNCTQHSENTTGGDMLVRKSENKRMKLCTIYLCELMCCRKSLNRSHVSPLSQVTRSRSQSMGEKVIYVTLSLICWKRGHATWDDHIIWEIEIGATQTQEAKQIKQTNKHTNSCVADPLRFKEIKYFPLQMTKKCSDDFEYKIVITILWKMTYHCNITF